MKKEIYYATGNQGKFNDVKKFIESNSDIEVKQLDVDLPEEQTLDQKAIAIDKAEQAWNYLQKPVFVDDSGMYFSSYPDFPGTMTKFVYKTLGFEGIYKLIQPGEKAEFILTLAYKFGPKKKDIKVIITKTPGILIAPPKEIHAINLPFEHVLIPDGYDKVLYDLRSTDEYKKVHCRLLGVKKLLSCLI